MPMTIDAWAQIPTPRMAASPWLAPLMRWTGRNAADLTPSAAHTLADMDRARVNVAILSAWHGPEGDLISNEEVAAQIEVAPDRFRGLAAVDVRRPVQAVREVRRWGRGEGIGDARAGTLVTYRRSLRRRRRPPGEHVDMRAEGRATAADRAALSRAQTGTEGRRLFEKTAVRHETSRVHG